MDDEDKFEPVNELSEVAASKLSHELQEIRLQGST
jgi:hypothetical protein